MYKKTKQTTYFHILYSTREGSQRMKDKREQYKKVKAHVRQDDGRVQAYGWSLPAKLPSPPKGPTQQTGNMLGVPVPVFCRPLAEKELGTKVSDIAPRFVSWS